MAADTKIAANPPVEGKKGDLACFQFKATYTNCKRPIPTDSSDSCDSERLLRNPGWTKRNIVKPRRESPGRKNRAIGEKESRSRHTASPPRTIGR